MLERSSVRRLGVAILVAALVVAPLLTTEFWRFVLATAVVYALAALSVNVLLGQAGIIGLFAAAFMGIGAYFGAAVANEGGVWILSLLAGVGAAVAIGTVVGIPGTRLSGMTFGILTFAFALAIDTVVFRHGFLGIDPALGASLARPELGGVDLNDDRNFYWFALAIATLTWIIVALHERSRAGRAWRAIRDDELTALAIGIPTGRYKLWAMGLSAGVAGLAGVLLLTLQSQVNSAPFSPTESLLVFAAAVVGGTRSVAGALIAGGLLAVLPELLNDAGIGSRVVPLVFAAGVILALQSRDGISGAISDALATRSARTESRS